jgi:hypothetical protein
MLTPPVADSASPDDWLNDFDATVLEASLRSLEQDRIASARVSTEACSFMEFEGQRVMVMVNSGVDPFLSCSAGALTADPLDLYLAF